MKNLILIFVILIVAPNVWANNVDEDLLTKKITKVLERQLESVSKSGTPGSEYKTVSESAELGFSDLSVNPFFWMEQIVEAGQQDAYYYYVNLVKHGVVYEVSCRAHVSIYQNMDTQDYRYHVLVHNCEIENTNTGLSGKFSYGTAPFGLNGNLKEISAGSSRAN